MSDIISILKGQEFFYSKSGVSVDEIQRAEDNLSLKFAAEYMQYLATFGAVSADMHEFTGLGVSPRLDVVAVTTKERQKNPNIPHDLYVIEQLHIDDIVIWQSLNGNIYQVIGVSEPVKIHDSFSMYINACFRPIES